MNIEKEKLRLSQKNNIKYFEKNVKMTDMVNVYYVDGGPYHHYSIYCALIPLSEKNNALSKFTWDLYHGSGLPVYEKYYDGSAEYFRYGNDSGVEPLIIDRDFDGMKDDYREISEEFRLFHKLYHDYKNNSYIKIDTDGNEKIIAVVETDRIQIRAQELREFLMVKDMCLSLQFDYREHTKYLLSDLEIEDGSGIDETNEKMCWGCHYGDFLGASKFNAFSRLLGKSLIFPMEKSNKESASKKYIDFIIDIDESGEEISHTSNPDLLADFFGNNPDSPNYLTAIEFRKSVLEKYYQEPSKYSVEDSYLRCGSLWGLQIDNHHSGKVCVWLGDLGRDLSYNEQLHWRSHNIAPEGGVSKTYTKRQLLAQFTSSDRLEHVFENQYNALQDLCEKKLGWQLLIPLSEEDKHHFDCLRIPATNEQRDFDSLVLSMTKILIDSLNEKKLNGYIEKEKRNDIKGGITRLEFVLNSIDSEKYISHISFLRKLQNLRSSSTAHRKGKNYKKIAKEFGVEKNDLKSIFSGIMYKSLELLKYFYCIIDAEQLKNS